VGCWELLTAARGIFRQDRDGASKRSVQVRFLLQKEFVGGIVRHERMSQCHPREQHQGGNEDSGSPDEVGDCVCGTRQVSRPPGRVLCVSYRVAPQVSRDIEKKFLLIRSCVESLNTAREKVRMRYQRAMYKSCESSIVEERRI